MAAMEHRLLNKMDSLEAGVNTNKSSIVILTDTLNKTTVDLARLESQFKGRVTDIVRSVIGRERVSSSLDRSTHERGLSDDQRDRYARCRRSLRLWPIRGDDLQAAVRKFLEERLGLDGVSDLGHIEVRKVVEPRSKIEAEAVAEFESAAVRDSVKSLGYKLEGQRAGIRIELPNFLKSDFHVLQNLSYRLKMANKTMKRSVKFDDDRYGLMLDIQLPGQDWRRIRPDQARAARSVDPSLQTGPSALSLDMIAGALGTTSDSGPPPTPDDPGTTNNSASGSNAVPLGRRAD